MEPPLDGPVPRAPYALATNDLIGINTSGRVPLESVAAFAWNTHPQTLCYAEYAEPAKGAVDKPGSDRCTPQPRATSNQQQMRRDGTTTPGHGQRPQQERHVWTVHHISCGGCSLSVC